LRRHHLRDVSSERQREVERCKVCNRELRRREGKRGDLVYYRCPRCGAQETRHEDVVLHDPRRCPECGSAGPFVEALAHDPRYDVEVNRFECKCGYWWCEW
jgi:predicted RNA-binding Zn-ribbon protein involved in translation (DUF1610 family)